MPCRMVLLFLSGDGWRSIMSKSPFPGMDPYLDQDWLDFQTRLNTYICDQLQEQLPNDLLARMESRDFVEDEVEEKPQSRHPDVRVVEMGGGRGEATAVLD